MSGGERLETWGLMVRKGEVEGGDEEEDEAGMAEGRGKRVDELVDKEVKEEEKKRERRKKNTKNLPAINTPCRSVQTVP